MRWSRVSPDLALLSWPSISKSLGKKFKAHGSSLLLCYLFCFKFPLTSSSFLCCYLKISFSNSDFFILLGLSISFFLSSLPSSVTRICGLLITQRHPAKRAMRAEVEPRLCAMSYMCSSPQRRCLFLTHTESG